MQTRSWYTPFWIMVVVVIFACIQSLILFNVILKATTVSVGMGADLYVVMLLPLVLLVETIIYWVIRKRIKERKWVWVNLWLSLFGFVILRLLYLLILFIYYSFSTYHSPLVTILVSRIEYYGCWSCIIFGQIFFIVAVVRNYSNKNTLQPADPNDLLSELPG
ncbi:hypothetical protein A3860_16245 [Niastella vici]|uniref:Uncharacterized protein n=1 Tax=Niastella vici TaxID=1703345 RepID=A0A1V9G3S2_9BACT|nr:hypothetical protein [Niastella vici]OQP65220.1 hypothetical protein A3860_16245 [Niastella vici]